MTPLDIILKYNPDAITPIPIFSIIEKMGIKINYIDTDINIFGRFNLNNEIFINKNITVIKQRFISAHMLNHILCGDNVSPTTETNNTTGSNNAHEIKSNIIASELLMPSIYIDILINKKNIIDIIKLSEIFDVSINAITYRLKKLNYY